MQRGPEANLSPFIPASSLAPPRLRAAGLPEKQGVWEPRCTATVSFGRGVKTHTREVLSCFACESWGPWFLIRCQQRSAPPALWPEPLTRAPRALHEAFDCFCNRGWVVQEAAWPPRSPHFQDVLPTPGCGQTLSNISGDPRWGKAPNLKLLLIKPRAAAQEAVSTEEGAEGRSQHVGQPR